MQRIPRKFWFQLHSWIGLKLSIMLFFILATGTLAVFAHEIDWLINPDMRVEAKAGRASWGEQLDAIRERYPDWTPGFFLGQEDDWFAAEIYMQTPEGKLRRVYVNPYTAEVNGDAGWFNAHRFFREAHRHLMMPVKIGVPVVSAFSFALLITLVSSFWVYKKWWRGFFQAPRRDRQRRFWGDVHRLAGVWSLWFVLLMAVTGGWYLVESLGGDAPPAYRPPAGEPDTPPPAVSGAQLDRMIEYVQMAWPELRVTQVRLPARDGQPVVIMGEASAWLVRPRANAVAFDPVTGEEVGRVAGGNLSVHQRIAEAADPLHFGNFGGLPTKIIWFVFGALLTALSGTGIYLYGIRVAGNAAAGPTRWRMAWHGIGHWRWPGLAMLLIVAVLLPGAVVR